MRTRITLYMSFPLFILFVALLVVSIGAGFDQNPLRRSETVIIHASINVDRVSPNEKVRMSELIPELIDAKVKILSHAAYLVGRYDENEKHFINLKPEFYEFVTIHTCFEKLPNNLGPLGDKVMTFSLINPRQKGFEHTFMPKKLGIFLITARWIMADYKQDFVSQPVILVVEPPIDELGKPIVNKEWLIK